LNQADVHPVLFEGHNVKKPPQIYIQKLMTDCFPDQVAFGFQFVGASFLDAGTLGDAVHFFLSNIGLT
jgi:hypothetical protein